MIYEMNTEIWDFKFATQLQGSVHGWGQGWLPVEPEAGISPPKGLNKSSDRLPSDSTTNGMKLTPMSGKVAGGQWASIESPLGGHGQGWKQTLARWTVEVGR